MSSSVHRERRQGAARFALDDTVSRRPSRLKLSRIELSSASLEEERIISAGPGASDKAKQK